MSENNENCKPKRQQIGKKLRFEVFKRDQFTCQYCGRKAPDVILQVDHIKPVANGGTNDILNLVTSCVSCNLGKGATELSAQTILAKQREQAELLAARREQIEMMRDWYMELADQTDAEVEAVNELFKKLTKGARCISESYKNSTIAGLIKKHGLSIVLSALKDGTATYGDPEQALNKLPGICACKSDPSIAKRSYLMNRMNKKFYNFKRCEASEILARGYRIGGDEFLEIAEDIYHELKGGWYKVKLELESLIREYEDENAGH